MTKVTRVGIDLGKHVYQVCGMDASGAVVFQHQVKAPRLMELMSRIEPCLVGMEASCGAHHWVRRRPRRLSPQAAERRAGRKAGSFRRAPLSSTPGA